MRRSHLGLLAAFFLTPACGDVRNDPVDVDPANTGGTMATRGTGGHAASGGAASGGATGAGGTMIAPGSGGSGTGGSAGNSGGPGGGGGTTSDDAGPSGSGGDPTGDDAGPPPPGDDAGSASPSDAALPPPPPGMTQIFDGKTMDGWECKPAIWSIKDGALYAKTGGPGEDLCRTKTDYSNFRLVFNERAVATTNHMGVGFWGDHTAKYGKALVVIPPSGHMWDYNSNKDVPNTGVGSANNPIKFLWHQVEVVADRTTGMLLVAVNGKMVTTYKDPNIAGRKNGPVGFQAHAGASEEEYKDVFIEADPKEFKLLTVK